MQPYLRERGRRRRSISRAHGQRERMYSSQYHGEDICLDLGGETWAAVRIIQGSWIIE
jgi:hypothetical protein